MRPAERQYAKAGTAPVETVRMGIDPDSAEFLMNVFTDLYSDTMMAPIREYISNALDSHAEAGQTRPIDVRKPSLMRPFFEVEDYGLGMSLDTIRRVYSMYGYSTKRHSDDYVGMLGVGSKSGLTYSNSMNITSVHDGTLVHFTISRGNKDASGKVSGNGADIDIHAVRATDKPNGVKVQLPVADVRDFSAKVDEFVQYAKPGSILVDGQAVTGKIEGATKVNDNLYLVRSNGYSHQNDVVVAGGVPYRAGGKLRTNLPYGTSVIAYVPVGTVEFTPSREDLQYTAKTEAALAALRDALKRDLRAAAVADIEGAPTYGEAWLRYERDWSSLAPDVKYKGVFIPTRGLHFDIDFTFLPNRQRNAVDTGKTFSGARSLSRTIIVYDFPNKTVTGQNRAKLRYYIDQNKLDVDTIWLLSDARRPNDPWDDTIRRVSWDKVNELKVPRAPRGSGPAKAEPTLEIVDINSTAYNKRVERAYDEVPAGDVLLVSPGETKSERRWDSDVKMDDIQTIYPDHVIVVIGLNRFDKFEREYDDRKVTRFSKTEFERKAKEFTDGLTDSQKEVLFGTGRRAEILRTLRSDRIEDADVAAAVDALSQDMVSLKRTWGAYTRINSVISGYGGSLLPRIKADDYKAVFDKYPLLEHVNGARREYIEQYINLMHKEQS